MLCDVCRKNRAQIFRTEIINGEKKEQRLCESCASEFLAFSIKDGQGNEIPIESILSGLLTNYARVLGQQNQEQLVCSRCGMTLMQFQKSSKMGCPECYTVFADLVDKNLINIQGSLNNCAKEPIKKATLKTTIKEVLDKHETEPDKQEPKLEELPEETLRVKMNAAVAAEDYEMAAQLRDIINSRKTSD